MIRLRSDVLRRTSYTVFRHIIEFGILALNNEIKGSLFKLYYITMILLKTITSFDLFVPWALHKYICCKNSFVHHPHIAHVVILVLIVHIHSNRSKKYNRFSFVCIFCLQQIGDFDISK